MHLFLDVVNVTTTAIAGDIKKTAGLSIPFNERIGRRRKGTVGNYPRIWFPVVMSGVWVFGQEL
jgi:hypothetical protein